MAILRCVLILQLILVRNAQYTLAKSLNNSIENMYGDLSKKFEELQKDVEDLKKLKESFALVSSNLSEIEDEIGQLDPGDPGPNDVYFTAVLTHDIIGLNVGETVIYGHAYRSNGVGYNNNTGIFTAPTSGVYLFAFFCNSLKARHTNLVVKENGRVAGNCAVEPAFDGETETGGDMFISRLAVGDRVWVEVYYSETDTADLHENLNTFAGVLIHR